MGKGRIVSHLGDGLYNVELLHNRERINLEIAFLDERIAALEAELATLETEREALAAERAAIATEIDAAVAATAEGEIPDVEALLVELAKVTAQVQAQDVRIALVQGRTLEATKRRQMLQSVPADPVQQAWCADFTEDLTGEVGTVEVPAEGVVGEFATWRRAQIRPGYASRATYLPARDGQMFHREGQFGYQAYFNAAILPGVQRWRPQYRIGTITSIDRAADTCTLQLQGEDSSAQSLIIDPPNLQYTLTNVPIEYMECDSAAFEESDRVLVEFQGRDWGQPKVIGFEANPRVCGEYAIFELYARRILTGTGDFGSCASDPGEYCVQGPDDGNEVGVLTTSWASGYEIRAANETTVGFQPLARNVDPDNAPTYQGGTIWSNFSYRLEDDTVNPDHVLDSVTGLTNTHIETFGSNLLPVFSDKKTLEGQFDLFRQVEILRATRVTTKIMRPFTSSNCHACTSPTRLDHPSTFFSVADIPNVLHIGQRWQPLGITHTDGDTKWLSNVRHSETRFWVLCKSLGPIPESE